MTAHPAYITVSEAADALGLHRAGAWRRVRDHALPALVFGGVIRIEARSLWEDAPDPIPSPSELTTVELAAHWRVDLKTVQKLIRSGALVARARLPRGWIVTRRSICRFAVDHSQGDDMVVEDPALVWTRMHLPEHWYAERAANQRIRARRRYTQGSGCGASFSDPDPEVVVRLANELEQRLRSGR